MAVLIRAKEKGDPSGWLAFQTAANSLKLQRSRVKGEVEELRAALVAAERATREAAALG